MNYDFVEIGTSNFRTLTQFVHGSDCSCHLGGGLRTWNTQQIIGLAVDPVEHLLMQLPKLPGVHTVPVAVGTNDGYATLHCIREDALLRYPKAYAARLASGTGRIGSPHPHLQKELLRDGIAYEEIVEERLTPVWPFEKLAVYYNIGSIDILKTDCEGADCDVLTSVIQYCDKRPRVFPRIISFETNDLAGKRETREILGHLLCRGYTVIQSGCDTTLKRASIPPIACCSYQFGVCEDGDRCFFDHALCDRGSCCFEKECVRGHSGAVRACVYCGADISHTWGLNYCDACFSRNGKRYKLWLY